MAELPENKVAYETIVITDSGRNASALSATRHGGYMHLRSFSGSNTFENLKRMEKFSVNYISHDNRMLFVDAALKGWGNDEREFFHEIETKPFPHMKKADGWAVCIPERTRLERLDDEIGETDVLHVDAKILMWQGSAGDSIKVGEDRNIMALVAYTRYLISEGDVREGFRRRILELAEQDDPVGSYILRKLKTF